MKILTLLFVLLFGLTAQAFAADFTVNLTTDQHDASVGDNVCDVDLASAGEQCTLRAAIEQANAPVNNVFVNDRVLFNLPPNSIITLTEANGGQIAITTEGADRNQLEIVGTGANNLTIDGGAGGNRIFSTTAVTTISGVTLTGGDGSDGDGGAILGLAGALTLDRVHVVRNTSPAAGGGVAAVKTVIINSTFSDNSAGYCGGLDGIDELTIVNSTISGNRASGSGGGVCSGDSFAIRSSTVTNNAANNGGGIVNTGVRFNFGNTIIAGNVATSGAAPEISNDGGSAASQGNNLIGDSAGDAANTGSRIIAYQSTDILDKNPLLGTLQNYGGTTPTHSLLDGSPAINAGNNQNAPAADQRGFARIFDVIIDIGAYESTLTTIKSRKRVRFF